MIGIDRYNKKFQTIDATKYDKKYLNTIHGKLTAISPIKYLEKETPNPKNERDKHWVFQCECGNFVCYALRSVVSRGVKDCGCVKDAIVDKAYIGKRYSRLVVIKRDYQYKIKNNLHNQKTYYLCQCDCGNITTVSRESLLSGTTKSCGCYVKELGRKILLKHNECEDLSTQKFFKLQPLYRDFEQEKLFSYPVTFWMCKCDCGEYVTVRAAKLKSGHTKSCGCLTNSYGEIKIEEILKSNNINFVKDKPYFQDLLLPSGNKGRYDFIIFDNQNIPIRIIEFDGPQHKKPNNLFGKEEFDRLQISDKIKNNYAIQHNIPLVRIPYEEKENLTLELLFSDKYLIKEEI